MSVPNVGPIHPVDVEIFHSISESFELLVALDERSGDHTNHAKVVKVVDRVTNRPSMSSLELCL